MITKIQKLSAIHNPGFVCIGLEYVVYDYKDTKIVSNSQRVVVFCASTISCLWLQRYKNCQQFTTLGESLISDLKLFMITKIQKLSAIHN